MSTKRTEQSTSELNSRMTKQADLQVFLGDAVLEDALRVRAGALLLGHASRMIFCAQGQVDRKRCL